MLGIKGLKKARTDTSGYYASVVHHLKTDQLWQFIDVLLVRRIIGANLCRLFWSRISDWSGIDLGPGSV